MYETSHMPMCGSPSACTMSLNSDNAAYVFAYLNCVIGVECGPNDREREGEREIERQTNRDRQRQRQRQRQIDTETQSPTGKRP